MALDKLPVIRTTVSVILSEAKNLLWSNARFSALCILASDSARDSSLHFVPFENDGQKEWLVASVFAGLLPRKLYISHTARDICAEPCG